jgi:hypothetical protein
MITFFGTLIRIFFHASRSKRIILSENALLKKENDRIGLLAANPDKAVLDLAGECYWTSTFFTSPSIITIFICSLTVPVSEPT